MKPKPKWTLQNCDGKKKRRDLYIGDFNDLGKTHEPSEVERGWYDWWVQQGYFNPRIEEDSSETFSLLLPPPNVTGTLHLGHALTGAVQDALVRWHRMKGHKVLWVPGTDHAGIATHAVVERKLWREQGKTKHDLGRDQFVKEIWKWKAQDKRMINWSCALQSSLSDIEVENVRLENPTLLQVPGQKEKVEFGILTSFAYPVENSDETLVVSTTRLETMLADTAVAVHPQDSRYVHLIGHRVKHPIDGGRLLPIIADDFVDMSFGTGAVKITPGHDHTDYEVGRRHDLPIIEMLADDGTLLPHLPLVGGQHRFEARAKLREALCLLGFYHGEQPHPTVLPLCSRSNDIVEPRLKSQWFLDCQDMAQAASQAVKSGKLKLLPEFHAKIWDDWLLNTRDWCLSRQLWWGHRIPVYTCLETGQSVCARTDQEAKHKLARVTGKEERDVKVIQDEDVLDTWFSSSLLPFSALGWPLKTQDLGEFFPQQLLETGQDILFFWVARMVMLSLAFTGQLPFDKVLLHGMVRDAHGRKMSKSLGNVIDPLDIVHGISLENLNKRLEQGNLDPSELKLAKEGQRKDFPNGIPACGSDALRFTLCSYNVKNMDINFDITHAESRKKFCNKIWQSFKFLLSKLESDFMPQGEFKLSGFENPTDLWILSRLSHMVHSCEVNFQSYDLHLVTSSLQQFWYQEFCDVYLEAVKPAFAQHEQDRAHVTAVCHILHLCADTFLRAAAPFMPFLCEELYQYMPVTEEKTSSVCIASYPLPEQSDDPSVVAAVQNHRTCVLALSRSADLSFIPHTYPAPKGCSSAVVDASLSIYVELKGGKLDIEKEVKSLSRRKQKLEDTRHRLSQQLEKLVAKGKGDISKAVNLREKLVSLEQEESKVDVKIHTLKDLRES
ncbi:valine--tRNA ligase [Elysia marginata]|uniref:valine--tRNA ligase n=1 Tax=Elysia marginata TaxID=1093978 RepID=A0AAV4IAN7_9GAST|nr:valine--tRNA ligase [Elysia marginata]